MSFLKYLAQSPNLDLFKIASHHFEKRPKKMTNNAARHPVSRASFNFPAAEIREEKEAVSFL